MDYADNKLKTPKTANGVRKVPIEPTLVPLVERMCKGRKATELLVPCLSAFGEDHLAQLFRKHLLEAASRAPTCTARPVRTCRATSDRAATRASPGWR